jgi:predicted DNA-binding protein YlxM (UPF0122 family)
MNIYENILRDISVKNKYLDWYIGLMSNARSRAKSKIQARQILGYVESHHILPRSFGYGGETDLNNLVHLSAREHIIAHQLLIKFSLGDALLASLRAFHCMCFKNNGGQNKRFPTTRQIATAREAARLANSGPRGIRGLPIWSKHSSIDDFRSDLISCVEDDMSDMDIARKFRISSVAVRNWRIKLDVPARRENLRTPQSLYQLYVVQLLSAGEIASLIGCSCTAVQQYLKRFNIPIRDAKLRQKLKKITPKVRDLYIRQLSCDEQPTRS